MDTQRLIKALVGLCGIWLLFRQLPDYAATLYVMLSNSELASRQELLSMQSIHFFSSVLFGIVLILVRAHVARWLVPETGVNEVQAEGFISAGVALIATFFVLAGVTDLGQYFGAQHTPSSTNPYLLWKGAFSIGGGIVTFIFSVGIGRAWSLIRNR